MATEDIVGKYMVELASFWGEIYLGRKVWNTVTGLNSCFSWYSNSRYTLCCVSWCRVHLPMWKFEGVVC